MRLPGKESMLMKSLITINEILDVSISFLNDHLEETLGSTKIEEIHLSYPNFVRGPLLDNVRPFFGPREVLGTHH